MICAVSMNPCMDRTVEIDAFAYGGMNRIRASRTDACGKGVNVALVLREMGLEAEVIGLNYAENGAKLSERLKNAGIPEDTLTLPGSVRTNLKVFDRETRRITEINESGETVPPEALEEMVEKVRAHAAKCDTMVFTGSLPPGCPPDFYARLIRAAGDCRCVLDAEGERLRLGLEAGPFLIKPNRYELELLLGKKPENLTEIRDAALQCAKKGIPLVAVSLGAEGAMITDGKTCLYAPPVEVEVRSTVGAGDSMVAGFLHALSLGEGPEGLLRRGVAAGTAAVRTEGTQLLRRADYEELLGRVEIQRI